MIPDWQLPPGTDRGAWDYLHSQSLAQNYDAALAGSPLLEMDVRFAARHFSRPGRLIDLGCGTGRLLVSFAQRGYWCLGVDLSEAMLEIASRKASQAGVPVAAMKANLVELDAIVDNSFDYAACLFSTFGMIRGTDHRRAVLRHVFRILRAKGRFIIHVHHRGFHWGFGLGKRGAEPGDRTMPQHYAGAELTLHHFTKGEILRELEVVGFRVLEVQPVSASDDGRLRFRSWFGKFRTYGYLIAAEKP
jgi:SAM-dependent methyltransferase